MSNVQHAVCTLLNKTRGYFANHQYRTAEVTAWCLVSRRATNWFIHHPWYPHIQFNYQSKMKVTAFAPTSTFNNVARSAAAVPMNAMRTDAAPLSSKSTPGWFAHFEDHASGCDCAGCGKHTAGCKCGACSSHLDGCGCGSCANTKSSAHGDGCKCGNCSGEHTFGCQCGSCTTFGSLSSAVSILS